MKNYAKKAFYLRYPKKLFWISIITISDIRNQSVSFLDIQNDTSICDIKNSYYGYPK